jgi:diguanylate cyclase (GGDEF)-like protein/PAS domain S-box-containing protein
MAQLERKEIQSDQVSVCPESTASHRPRTIRVLFLHRDGEAVNSCLRELRKAQFTVKADCVLNMVQCMKWLQFQSYDVVVAEYPHPCWKEAQALHLFQQTIQEIPLVFVISDVKSESIAQLNADGAFDYIKRGQVAQFPMALRRVMKEKKLRADLEKAEKDLRHSESLYRALVENPAYGICRCDAEGHILDANEAFLGMLGYSTVELLAANLTFEMILDGNLKQSFAGTSSESAQIEPVEMEWKRKNGTSLKVKLSGRGVFDDHGKCIGYALIAVDLTEQRTLENDLLRRASSDSLTGLANHGRLFEVLYAEICRSKRTGREFSLVLLDLDGLKRINDQFGHQVGNRALCRLAEVLVDCCRFVDTAARQGGDEFAVVLPETGVAAATLVAKRICELLANNTETPALSVSIGVASYPKDAETIGTLLYAADKALYAMKDKQPMFARVACASH